MPHLPASISPAESARLDALRALMILDTPPDPLFDTLARLAATACNTPVALISLVDEHRQWFLSQVGLPGVHQTPREQAFCAHTILSNGVLEVPDAQQDPRFADNPLVTGAPHIRFYAGAPLLLPNGTRVGTLCVIDQKPGQLDPLQRDALQGLARTVVQALLTRRDLISRALDVQAQQARELAVSEARYRSIVDDQSELVSLAEPSGRLVFANPAYAQQFGHTEDSILGHSLYEFVAEGHREQVRSLIQEVLSGAPPRINLNLQASASGRTRWLEWTNRLHQDKEGRRLIHSVGRDVTERHVAEERLSLATEANHIGIWEFTLSDQTLIWNDMMFRIFDLPREAFTGRYEDWTRRVHPEDLERSEQELRNALDGLQPLDFDFRVVHRDGSVHHIHARAQVFRDEAQRPVRVLGINFDVSARKQIERELAEKHELLRVTLTSIGDAVITTDAGGSVQWMNPVAERMTGWSSESAHRRSLGEVFHIVNQATREPEDSLVRRALEEGNACGTAHNTLLISRAGSEYGIEHSAAPIRDEAGAVLGVVLVFHDVTEQRRLSTEMSYRALHDDLTDLVNRTEFERQLEELLEACAQGGRPHALLFIDLDQFKLVNDACGHAVGDQLLCRMATLLRESVRTGDTVARLGGDEFAIILQHCPVEQAQRVAQKICDQMDEFRFVHDGRRFRIGTSIGLVPLDNRWPHTTALLQAADTSCQAAKEEGRNRVHCWYDANHELKARSRQTQWASRIETALDEDRFELWGQRIAPLQEGAPKGLHCEVLLRLRDADGSIIAPGAFMPTAERFHMASRIDRWVVRKVFEWMNQLGPAHADVDLIAVNLSGQSIGDRAFHRDLVEQIRQLHFPVHKICFEVTETAAITRMEDASRFIAAIRALGVQVALDDFGAGASSFGYLKALAVDVLKIDGQFVRDLKTDPLNRAAVRCFREVARATGMKTIAEFVEHQEVFDELRALGIDAAQGYLIHRPQPLVELLQASVVA